MRGARCQEGTESSLDIVQYEIVLFIPCTVYAQSLSAVQTVPETHVVAPAAANSALW